MVLVRHISRPYLKIKYDYSYQIPFIESLQHLFKQHHLVEEVSTAIGILSGSYHIAGKVGEFTCFVHLAKKFGE